MTTVVNIRNAPYDIYIGRANGRYGLPQSPYANPFRIGPDADRDTVIELYRSWVLRSSAPRAQWIREHVHELRRKTLGCWCRPERCHGDVLAEMADSSDAKGGDA